MFIAAAATWPLDYGQIVKLAGPLTAAQTQVGPALLGVVLAGLAVLVVFLDREYIALLESVPPGVEADLFPFRWTAAVAAATILSSLVVSYSAVLPESWWLLLRVSFWFGLASFIYMIWITLDLMTFLAGHARVRIAQIKQQEKN